MTCPAAPFLGESIEALDGEREIAEVVGLAVRRAAVRLDHADVVVVLGRPPPSTKVAGAYRAAGGNSDRAVALYASGYGGRGVQVSPEARAAYAYERGSRRGRGAVTVPTGALAREVR